MTLPETKTERESVFRSTMGDPALGRSTAPPEWGSPPPRWATAQGTSVAIANVAARREQKEENAIGPPGKDQADVERQPHGSPKERGAERSSCVRRGKSGITKALVAGLPLAGLQSKIPGITKNIQVVALSRIRIVNAT